MKTITEAVAYLVAQGNPLASARVAIDQAYNFADDTDTSGLLLDSEQNPVEITEIDANAVYNDFCGPNGYFTIKADGYYFDGEVTPMYDLAGNYL